MFRARPVLLEPSRGQVEDGRVSSKRVGGQHRSLLRLLDVLLRLEEQEQVRVQAHPPVICEHDRGARPKLPEDARDAWDDVVQHAQHPNECARRHVVLRESQERLLPDVDGEPLRRVPVEPPRQEEADLRISREIRPSFFDLARRLVPHVRLLGPAHVRAHACVTGRYTNACDTRWSPSPLHAEQ